MKTMVATAAAMIKLMAQYRHSGYRDQCSRVLAQLHQVKHTWCTKLHCWVKP